MTPITDNGLVHLVSGRSVAETLERLLSLLKTKGVTVFAVVDHSGEAAKVGLEMHETKLVIFGNPIAGTPVMIAAPDSAIDLPLKILIAEGSDGKVRVSYNTVAYLQARYAITPEVAANLAAVEHIAAAIVRQVPSD